MIEESSRIELIPELDRFLRQADEMRKEIDSCFDSENRWKEPYLANVSQATYGLVKALREAGDTLKRANQHIIEAYAIDHYRFRVEIDIPEDQIEDPVIESIEYQGNDRWFVVMSTTTHGREKMTIDTDTASWEQLYDAQPM